MSDIEIAKQANMQKIVGLAHEKLKIESEHLDALWALPCLYGENTVFFFNRSRLTRRTFRVRCANLRCICVGGCRIFSDYLWAHYYNAWIAKGACGQSH